MAKTIPDKARGDWPRGTYRAQCDYCSGTYMRHQLVRNESGLLACTGANGCSKGREAVQLSRMNAEHGAQVFKHPNRFDGGRDDERTLPVIHRTTADDILRIDS